MKKYFFFISLMYSLVSVGVLYMLFKILIFSGSLDSPLVKLPILAGISFCIGHLYCTGKFLLFGMEKCFGVLNFTILIYNCGIFYMPMARIEEISGTGRIGEIKWIIAIVSLFLVVICSWYAWSKRMGNLLLLYILVCGLTAFGYIEVSTAGAHRGGALEFFGPLLAFSLSFYIYLWNHSNYAELDF